MAEGTRQQAGTGSSRGDGRPAMGIDELVPRLREAFGEALRCVVLYGSAVGAGTAGQGGREDSHLLVLVDALSVETLERAARVIGDWVSAGHPAPLTLTTAEWRSWSRPENAPAICPTNPRTSRPPPRAAASTSSR